MRAVSRLGYEREDAIVDQHVSARPGFRILELCCGTARAGRRWVARGAEVLGVDRSVQMLTEARRRCGDGRLVLLRGDACRQLTSFFFSVCDGDPSASGYRGLPAVEATRKGIATFRRTFGPLVLLGMEPGLETLGTTAVVWRDGQFANPLCRVLQAILSA